MSRALVTSYYVTDIKQMSDFAWYRESGLRINVAVQNVNVIATYDDVSVAAGGDNAYVRSNPGTSHSELERFAEIVNQHCRLVEHV